MGLPAKAELRRDERLQLVDRELPGMLVKVATDTPIFAVAVDVSRRGLGIQSGELLPAGCKLRLVHSDGMEVQLVVVWSKRIKRRDATLYRHGLMVIDDGVDLNQLFFSFGRLDVEPAASMELDAEPDAALEPDEEP